MKKNWLYKNYINNTPKRTKKENTVKKKLDSRTKDMIKNFLVHHFLVKK